MAKRAKKVARRVVVTLEPAAPRQALEAAAALAEQLRAELVGLFVEDESLLHLAGLPFAREVGFPSAASRPLDVEAMERSLRAQAREAEQRLAAAASRAPLAWSFRVTRGTLPEALLEAALEAELLVSGFAPGPGIPFEVAAVSPDGESASETLRALCERHGVRFLRAANEKELKKLLRALRRTG